jgi:hypothetical protein
LGEKNENSRRKEMKRNKEKSRRGKKINHDERRD